MRSVIFDIYKITVIVSGLLTILLVFRIAAIMKRYKSNKTSVPEQIRAWILTLIICVIPIVNVFLTFYTGIWMDKEDLERIIAKDHERKGENNVS